MAKNKVAVIDGGGRGAALVDKYLQSGQVGSVIAIPGNDMMRIGRERRVETYPGIRTVDVKEIVRVCSDNGVAFVDVAQDNAIQAGLVDELQRAGIPALGPTKAAGEIEWSKAFARKFGSRHALPQPEYGIFSSEREGVEYVLGKPGRAFFVKADGLCEGKGALPAEESAQAMARIKDMGSFKDAGATYVIETWLRNSDGTNGEEFSSFGISDGMTIKMLGNAQDHKRVGTFDVGKNTGGTGCSTPPLVLSNELKNNIQIIFDRTIEGLHSEGRTYRGILYLGGILVNDATGLMPYVVEFNSRWGDPEAQVILPGIKNDLFAIGMDAISGGVEDLDIKSDGKARVVVAAMSRGYPDNYQAVKGKEIFGLNRARSMDGVRVYGAGVKVENGRYYANGGRLFYIVGEGDTVVGARERAYSAMSGIFIEGNNLHYRTDIGWRDMDRLLRAEQQA